MAKHPRSLSGKLMAALLLSAVVSLGVYFAAQGVGNLLIRKIYMAPAREQARVTADMQSFRSYVGEHEVRSADAVAIGAWNREHPYVRLTVSGRDTVISSDSHGADILLADSVLSLRTGQGNAYEFPVNFADGAFPVTIYHYSEVSLRTTVTVASVLVSAAVFLLCMSLYERMLTRSIQKLSRQVRRVSQGELQMQIIPQTEDEIGTLAADVDTMRQSMIQRLREEEQAWQANQALITAISHDVRTPLTALMGYLEILSDDSLDPESREAYLQICRSNSQRLKELTDELFRFFLLFGKAAPDMEPEDFDGPTLIRQILFEAQMELTQQGFAVELRESPELTGTIRVDLKHFRRVFDNIFSNIRKYADKTRPVTVEEILREGNLTLSVTNHIPRWAQPAESNKIGLKTCEKLMDAMGGSFRSEKTGDRFRAELTIPLR